ncbi:MAG: hypothetical protein Q7N50_07410, partial [Armatimonadota bacterium]|nr:hypothetical protein [Armatimonadota bacterium]
LSDYLAHTKELQPEFTATVSFNSQKLGVFKFDKNSLFQPEREIIIKANQIHKGSNSLHISMSGKGRLYYNAEFVQYIKREGQPRTVTASGITINRTYQKLVPRWDERLGAMRLQPVESSSTDFASGDTVRVKLTVNSLRNYYYVLVEDFLPAGCEAFDRGRLDPWEWTDWWVDKDVRDDRVSFYVDKLPGGKSVLEYEFRASIPGTYRAMPPTVQAMYDPFVTAAGLEEIFRVR